MVKTMIKKRSKTICGSFIIIFVILSICPIISSAYSNQFPSYLGFDNCAYIEINSSLGVGTVVIPSAYQYDYLTTYNGNTLANMGTGTISGYFIRNNGTSYSVRIQSLNTLQYSTQSGYQVVWNDLSFTEILNTNCNIKTFDSSSFDMAYHFTTGEICIISLLILSVLVEFFKILFAKVRYARTF